MENECKLNPKSQHKVSNNLIEGLEENVQCTNSLVSRLQIIVNKIGVSDPTLGVEGVNGPTGPVPPPPFTIRVAALISEQGDLNQKLQQVVDALEKFI